MIGPFHHEALPQRVLFGPGRIAELADEVRRLGARRVLVLSTPGQRGGAERAAGLLGGLAGAIFDGAVMHTPVEVTEAALVALRTADCDGITAVGGGSTIGLGKALALHTDLPQIAVPTTYAGCEATPIIGQTENGAKTTRRTPKVLPEVVIYDAELTQALPAALTAASGMNAIAHAVEALYARDANPAVSLMAEEGIRALAASLPRLVEAPADLGARAEAQYGAWLCGTCLEAAGMALHHRIRHVLGGAFNLPHAETHAIVLPHVAAYNAAAAPEAFGRVARAVGAEGAWQGLHALAGRLGIARGLRDLGLPVEGIAPAVEAIARGSYWNPRPVEPAALRRLLERAFEGAPPAAA